LCDVPLRGLVLVTALAAGLFAGAPATSVSACLDQQ
jgi:hypothetical protein